MRGREDWGRSFARGLVWLVSAIGLDIGYVVSGKVHVSEPSQGDAMTYLIHILGPGRDIVPVVSYHVRHGQLFASLSVWIRGY